MKKCLHIECKNLYVKFFYIRLKFFLKCTDIHDDEVED